MYYVVQVAPGKENETEKYIMERVPSELYFSCFHPVRHMRKKYHGEWKEVHEKLLPGYVFIRSERIQEVYQKFKQIPALTKLLGWNAGFATALSKNEAEWLEKIVCINVSDEIKGDVPLSWVEISEKDEIRILSGPLKDMAGMVKRIDLHKRIAMVEVEFMGRKVIIHLGIEIIGKK